MTTPVTRFRLRVTQGEHIAIGPGKVALLEAIAATGSISAAGRSLGMSYRRAWLLVGELEASLAEPAVRSVKGGASGGGSELTAVGHHIVELYRRIEQTATDATARDLAALERLLGARPDD